MPAYCRNCGTKLSVHARFCRQCGLQIDGDAALPLEQPGEVTAAPPAAEPTAGPAVKLAALPARPRRKAAGGGRKLPALLLALGAGALLLCVLAVVGGVQLFRMLLLGREDLSYGEPAPGLVPEDAGLPDSFAPGQPAPPETVTESVEGLLPGPADGLALSDGTRLALPAAAAPVQVALTRLANDITLPGKPALHTSGSMRVVEYDLAAAGENFAPRLTIPASELGSLDLATVNVLRVAQLVLDGQPLPDQVAYLPVQRDASGNLLVVDGLLPSQAEAARLVNRPPTRRLASLQAQSNQRSRAKYVLMTFQDHLEWSYTPRLVRMIPDASLPEGRRPADPQRDQEALQQPVTNVIVLVHGHNEEEKDGSSLESSEIQPWGVAYKRDAWIEFYKAFIDKQQERLGCTAFYEFIYPTYRAAYSPIAGSPSEPLGDSLARALAEGALNDDRQLYKLQQEKMPINLYLVAHSMGGLVARAGIRQLNQPLANAFQQLVTWGTPHHGSPLVSMGYLFRAGYKVNYGKLREAKWFPSYVKEGDIDLLLGSGLLKYLLDTQLQLDTPGTRDLRWDNFSPLRLDEIFSSDTEVLLIEDPESKLYNLVDGTWLYNDNLRQFNQSDPYLLSDKYTFIYGVTSKRMPDGAQTAIGATLLPFLLKYGDRPVSAVSGGHVEGDSDGAVPLASMAGAAIVNFRSDDMGDVDHEEYYSGKPDYGDRVAYRTFSRLGLELPRCTCPVLELQPVGDLQAIAVDAPLEVKAQLRLDPTFEPKPGTRLQSAEALFLIAGGPDEYALGDLDFDDDGNLTGSFSMPDLGPGEHQLVARAHFRDDTQLDSIPEAKALYTGLRVLASPVSNGYCYTGSGDIASFSYMEEGDINWTGSSAFTAELINNDFVPIVLEKLSGVLTPDGKSLTLQFEYAYHDESETTSFDRSGSGSFIDIPFVEHVVRDGLVYDRFVFDGSLDQLRPHMQFWHREGYTTSEGPDIEETSMDMLTSCDDAGKIEVWMIISGRDYTP